MSDTIQNINNIAPMKGGQGEAETSDEVKAEYLEGKGLLERGETAMAAVALHNALVGYEERNDENGIANACNQLGNACLQREEYDKAIENYLRAEDICRKLGDPISVLAVSRQIIEAQRKKGNFKEAINRCLDILDLHQANNNPKGTVELLEKMAEIYIEAGSNDKAADTYRTIASIHRNYKHDKIADKFLAKADELKNG